MSEEQVLFSLPLQRMEPIFKRWVREVIQENPVNNEPSEELISRAELKELTGIASDVTVIKFERLGIFKPIRLGRRLMYRKHEVKVSLDKLQKIAK